MATPTVTGTDGEPVTPSDSGRRRRRPHLPGRATWLRLAASLVGGVLLYLANPPRGELWWLAPIGFALLGLALHGRRARAGFGYGFLFGLAFLAPLLHWTGLYVGVIAWWPLSAFEAAIVAVGTAAIAVVSRMRGAALWSALLWIAGEALRARAPFGGLPWGKVAFGQPDGSYASLVALGGTPLVGFAVVLTGFGLTALILALRDPARRRIAGLAGSVAAIVLPIVAGIAAWPLVGTDPNAGTATVAAIQGNVPRLGLDFNSQIRAVLDYHVTETEKLAGQVAAGKAAQPQLVIWPENSSDVDPYQDALAYSALAQAAAAIKAPIAVGAVLDNDPGNPGERNTVLLWEPGKGPVSQYTKRKLLPFGETIPWRSFFGLFTHYAYQAGNFQAGTKPVVFPMGPAKVALDTCYEVAFDDVVRESIPGSTLLAVPTNNATFGLSEMTYQQLAMDQMRAIEHGRSVVVAATSGVSAIIQPDGTITQETGLFTPAALDTTVPLRSSTTLADRLADWPEWTMVAGGLVALAFGIMSARRRRAATAGVGTTDMQAENSVPHSGVRDGEDGNDRGE